jgi:hypothetical protein
MDEIRLQCLACGWTGLVPMSDQYSLPDGTVVDASELELPDGTVITANDLADDAIADAVRDYLQGMPCRGCGSNQVRITLGEEASDA